MGQNKNISVRESEDMLEFRDWMDGQVGEEYSESELKDYGWQWQGEEDDCTDGIHAKRTRWTMADRGVPYVLEVTWANFTETVLSYRILRDTPETSQETAPEEPKDAYRITFRSELVIRASSEKEAEAIFADLDLYSADALKYGASWVETNSIDRMEGN